MVFRPKNCLARPDLPDLPDLDPGLTVHLLKEVGGTVVDGIAVTLGCGLMTDVDHHGSPWITMDHQAQQIQTSRSVEYLSVDHYVVIVVQIDCDCH